MTGLGEFIERAAVGPIPGEYVIVAGILFHASWMIFAIVTLRLDQIFRRKRQSPMQPE